MRKQGSSWGNKRLVLIPLAVCGLLLYGVPRNAELFFSALQDLSMRAIACLVAGCYGYFYLKNYGKTPTVFCKSGTRLASVIEGHIPSVKQSYMPLFWCPEGRCITIMRNFTPCRGRLQYRNEVVKEQGGGQFYLKWCDNDQSERFPQSATRPTVLILPGVTSNSKSSYIRSMAYRLILAGYRVVILVYRGLEDMEVLTPLTYCATNSSDANLAIEKIKQRFPEAKLFSVGASLGSLILANHLMESGERCLLDGAMFFCCPFNAPVCAEEVETWVNHYLINSRVAAEQKRLYRRNSQVFESHVDHERIINARDLRDFDHHFTAPLFGYKSAEEYYEDCILDQEKLNAIKIPLVCVGANDDPFSPEHGLPKDEIANTEHVALVMTHGGGHVSHLQGFNPFGMTYFEQIMVEYFDGLLPTA